MTGAKKAKLLIVLFVGLVLVLAVASSRTSYTPSNVIGDEIVSCVTAVCVSDSTLGNCIEFPPRVARVVQTTDVNSGAVRLVVSLNNTCKGK